MTALAIRTLDLPWTLDPVAERRFRRILRGTTLAALVLALLIPWLPLPERDATAPPEVPERYARLMLERTPPPPPVVAQAEPEPEPASDLAEPTPEKVPAPQPRTAAAPAPQPSARERAASAGVMAFADTLAELRANEAVAAATAADGLSAGAGETRHNERSVITAAGGRSSGGINTAAMSRDTGGSGVGGREVTRVASALPGGGAGPAGGRGDGSGPNSRSREEIELVFDRNKTAIYALYNRALRSDPMLRGRLVLELTIAPSGEVTDCRVVSSELADPEFERRLVARVMLFRFEDKDVATVTTTKPIEFFPA
jgi:periplasmic protein TonB